MSLRLESPMALAFAVLLNGCSQESGATQSAAAAQTCKNNNFAIREELRAVVHENAKCDDDTDCEIISIATCPLGCYPSVAKENAEKIRVLVREAKARLDPGCPCVYKCMAPKQAHCGPNGICTSRR